MQEVYKADPLFINFVPRTATEAVDRFTRCRRRGLNAYRIPECVVECAKGLSAIELDRFEQWLINPLNVDVVNVHPCSEITDSNDAMRKELYDDVYGQDLKAEAFPPIANQVDLADLMETCAPRRPDSGDEKLPETPEVPEVPEVPPPSDPPSLALSPDPAPSVPPAGGTEELPTPVSPPTCAAL